MKLENSLRLPLTPNAGYELATSGQLDGIPCDAELDVDEMFDVMFDVISPMARQ